MGLDQNVPKWLCQICRHPFLVAGADAFVERFAGESSRAGPQASVHGGGSVFAGSRMDHSYVVLPKQERQAAGFPPPRPRSSGSGIPYPMPGSSQPVHQAAPAGDREGPVGRAMDGSFVVLPSAAASMYRVEALSDGSAGHQAGVGVGNQHTNNASFNATVNVLTRVFEIASAQTQVDQPLCMECMRTLSEELDMQLDEVSKDIKAYKGCLERLGKESHDALSEEEFARDQEQVEEEERELEAEIQEVQAQTAFTQAQLREIEQKTREFEELEDRFWQDANEFRFELAAHQDERDAILAKIEVTQSQLEMLKRTNVLNDAFFIWHDGDFGTINNFRLGRLPNVPVEWDEINAAWGQACLLLYTMAQFCHLNFTYRIMPLGSYPRIADSKNTYELFGPVNLFWSTRYDKAMTCFLACLKEFAEFANAKDRVTNLPEDKWFSLPYKIEGDKVQDLTVTQSFNRQEKWTKALKYTLCDLKWALYWLIGNMGGANNSSPGASAMPSSAGAASSARRLGRTGSSGSSLEGRK